MTYSISKKTKRHIPLDVEIIGPGAGFHGAPDRIRQVVEGLMKYPAVRSIRYDGRDFPARGSGTPGTANTFIIDPSIRKPEDFQGMRQHINLILDHRINRPKDVFVICSGPKTYENMCNLEPRFRHYFSLIDGNFDQRTVLDVLRLCENWHRDLFWYDTAISFAGDQRVEARGLADALVAEGVKVFFDEYEQSEMLGKNLVDYLYDIYANQCRHCVMFISSAYAEKMWTAHERAAAQARALRDRGSDYILPIRVDDTQLPGMPDTIGYLTLNKNAKRLAKKIIDKIFVTQVQKPKTLRHL